MQPRLRGIILLLVMACLLAGASGAFAQAKAQEEFQYRWQLRNFMGNLAGLFLPNHGEGSLTFRTEPNGHLLSELSITSSAKYQGEYFRYGSEIDTKTLQPIRAWSAYSWRGETKSKSGPIKEEGVLDVASGIYAIRQDPPEKPRRMEIWSDGKIYPVVVMPLATATRKMRDGRKLDVRRYSIRGVDIPGRRKWKGKLDLWLTRDEAATPVEIVISRNLADVHMELKDLI
ncbi:MAG TPA: DUF3108 domain-containing protein [Thermoanaerobaculia bacterium]|nr:DUF3108 domain-containing protein [Thermoanaerobaculia bacterium]